MSHDLRFQVLILPNAPWPEYRDRFVHIEDLGFDVGACRDHFCNWADPPGYWLEAWTGLAGIAASTSTLRLTTCVTQIPLRNPGVLAHQAVTLDHVSGGRFELGLGTGIDFDPSCEMVGIPNWGNKERVDRFAEYIEVVAEMLPEARAGGGVIRYCTDPDLFVDLVQRLTALGMSEISVYYPTQADQIREFEHIARQVIPQLRADHSAV